MKAKATKQKKNGALKSCFLGVIALVVILGCSALFLTNWFNKSIYENRQSDEVVEVTVHEGDTVLTLMPLLKENDLITSEEAVKIYLKLNDVSPSIKVGTYSIPKSTNFPGIIQILEQGVFKKSITVTLREGLRYEQIASVLDDHFQEASSEALFSSDDFIRLCSSSDTKIFSQDVQEFLDTVKPSDKTLRGFLFPDTYNFDFDASAQTVIETLIRNLMTRLEANEIDYTKITSGKLSTFYDALILASIIEKEASANDDLELISGIFHNRLNDGLLLQADSTVNFITGKNDPGVLISDTKIDSPYNTYKYLGLPPTPINNPGITTIKAALTPKSTRYYYFVHDAAGKSYFATTFAEHQQNVQRYL